MELAGAIPAARSAAARSALRARRRASTRLDLVHLAVEKVTLALEGIGAGRVRVNSASLDHPLVILAGEALEIVGNEKKRSAYWLNHDPSGLVEAGYGPTTK
jgi:hypothetical protein